MLDISLLADMLRLDCSGADDSEKLAINELLEVGYAVYLFLVQHSKSFLITILKVSFPIFWVQVVTEESKNGPLIVFLKDVEKSMGGSVESYLSFKNKVESLPAGVLLIGSIIQMDNRKEKVVDLLFNICHIGQANHHIFFSVIC